MDESTVQPRLVKLRAAQTSRYVLIAAILVLLLAGAFFGYRAWTARSAGSSETPLERISAGELEERYGLRVRLIGVTAGGGMVDFRLKIVDPAKARRFLEDPANLPRLVAAESGEALVGTQGMEDEIRWEEGEILFILFSNRNGAIRSGSPVLVEFGSLQLEPIPAQ
jgi:hypothetical protein